jgi:pimeloyl-ACP methyl ester carboxylesterase
MHKLYTDDWLTKQSITLSGGETLYYWSFTPDQPDGLVALFLHGMKGNHAGLSALAWEYKRMCPNSTIIIPDLPGYGISEPYKAISNAALSNLYTQTIKELINHINARHYVLIGHSFGAILGYTYLSATQDTRINRAYLYGTHVTGRSTNGRVLGLYRLVAAIMPRRMQRLFLYNVPLNQIESVWFTKTKDPQVRAEIYKSRRTELGFKQPPTLLASFYLSSHVDLRALPVPVHTQITFIHGVKDNIAAFGPLKQLAALNDGSKIVTLQDVGHYMVNEDAEDAAQVFVDA